MASRGERRRESRGAGASSMGKFYWAFGAVAVIGVAIVGYSVGSSALGTAVTEPVEVEGLDDMTTLVSLANGVTKGDENAPITIIEFGDYQCPGCGSFALSIKPQVELQYVQTGKAKFIFYDYPLIQIHPNAFLAARAGRCAADQDRFWEYHDELFRNQPRWSADAQPIGAFLDYADDLGLDSEAFEACVRSDRHADVITANMRLATELGVSGTPTIMISRGQGMARRLNDFSFRSIQMTVEGLLEEAGADAGN